MALGAVQSGYAGSAYAYRRTKSVTGKGYGDTSQTAQASGEVCGNSSKIIGHGRACLRGADKNYSLKAQYAAESTEDTPIIEVTAECGGERVSYKVDVNRIDPRNASQLEMFALLSYSDDQEISDGGVLGSYGQMEVYADNAQMNGYWEGNQDWDSFVDAKHDWMDIMNRMTDDYSQAGIYSQYLNVRRLEVTLSHFSIRHVDVEHLKIEDRSADMFSKFVLKAWLETAGERFADEMDTDMFTHMTSVMIGRFKKYWDGDASGNSVEAALKAVREAMQALEYPLASELKNSSVIQEELEEEREFYQSFMDKLQKLQEEQNRESDKTQEEQNRDSDKVPEETDGTHAAEELDMIQYIRLRMKEIFVLIQNGDEEASFQIGSSSFTVKEWEEFLKKFDNAEDAIKELMREELEKRAEEAERTETAEDAEEIEKSEKAVTAVTEKETMHATGSAAAVGGDAIDALVSESTKCTYPSSVPGQKDIQYITWYTEEGIFCRKAGQSEGYEWSIAFEHKEDYRKVMEFLDRFDREDNLRFAAHENFWKDFLKGKIHIEGFMKFYEGTDHGVPDYTVTKGDSMYVDRDKLPWAKYMNFPGAKLYTREEMMRMQEE